MKNQKVTVKFYGSNEETEMYSFDRTTFDLIVKANETLAEMVNDKDHRIAVLERALELACEEIELNKQGKTKGTLALQKIINEFGIGKELSDKEYFIQQAEKELEEE